MNKKFQILGSMVKKQRLAKKLSQHEVATKLGYGSAQFVSNVERGMCAFPLVNMRKLGKIIDLDLKQVSEILVSEYTKEVQGALLSKSK